MKKMYSGIAAFALLTVIFLGVAAGGPFLQMIAGPQTEMADQSFEQMEGNYITYEVTHPVVSFAEEYYSGDPGRVSKVAYVAYDETRQAFIKIVVPERKSSELDDLLRAVNRSEELKAQWGDEQAEAERPVPVSGSLMAIADQSEVQTILEAMSDSDSFLIPEMNVLAMGQKGWYVLEEDSISGIKVTNLWICAVTGGVALFVALLCLLLLRKKADKAAGGYGSAWERLLEKQRVWLEPWCAQGCRRRIWQGFLILAGAPAGMAALGIAVGADIKSVLTCHLPIGLAVGELCGLMLAAGGGAFAPDKIIRILNKNMDRLALPQAEQEALAEELLETDVQWSVFEKGKEEISYGILGERFWIVFSGKGILTVMDSHRIEKMETETVSGQIRVGKVRTYYHYYSIRAFYRDSPRKKDCDVFVNFNAENTAEQFMALARRRLGERAEEVIQ